MLFIFMFLQNNQKYHLVIKNKMDNRTFVDEETTGMVHQDEDYDEYNTPNTNRVDQTPFMEIDNTEATSTLHLRQKVKRNKITAL